MKKKIIEILVIMLLITSAALPAVSTMNISNWKNPAKLGNQNQEGCIPQNNAVKPIPMSSDNMPLPKSMEGKKISLKMKSTSLQANIPVAATPDNELHPTLAMSSSGSLFGAYSLQPSIFESNIIYTFSGDGGATWQDVASYNLEGFYDYPAVDYLGSGDTFVATFAPDPDDFDGSAQYRIIIDDPSDPSNWDAVSWDWSSFNQRDRESPDIAGYDNDGTAPSWYYGIIADTQSSDNPDYPGEHNPVLNFADYADENSGWFWIFTYNNSAHACVDVDRSNGFMYAAWDYYNESTPENGRSILLCTGDLHDFMAENWVVNWSVLSWGREDTFPDVGAENGYIYIVSQENNTDSGGQDIVCFYSHDNGATWNMSNISADPAKNELYPSIVVYGEKASCIFTVDGDLYVSDTDDGGVTWSIPGRVNDEPGSVSMEYRTAKVTTSGHTLWTDTRNGNQDIYYGNGAAPAPLINIKSISGGLGVSAVIENTGTGDATDLQWSIDLEGGLILLGGHTEGTIPTLAAGASETVEIPLVLGIGGVTIAVTAGDSSKTASGTVLLVLVLGVQ